MRCYIDWEDAEVGYGVISVFMTGQGHLLQRGDLRTGSTSNLVAALFLASCSLSTDSLYDKVHACRCVMCCIFSHGYSKLEESGTEFL